MEHIRAALEKAKLLHMPGRPDDVLIAPFCESEPESPEVQLPNADAAWVALPQFSANLKLLRKNKIVTPDRTHAASAQFDMLRTTALQKMRENHWTTVGVTSPSAGCGKTSVILNLALSLANNKDCRTVLLDFDLRRPQLAKLLGIKSPPSIEAVLNGSVEPCDALVRYGDNLAIGVNGAPTRFSAELLQSASAARALENLRRRLQPNVILIDLPPMLATDDVIATLPNVDAALLVVAAEASSLREVDLCERILAERSKVLGVVLNKCRFLPDQYGY
jgi:Mrp family chromosome partitioning ATPase